MTDDGLIGAFTVQWTQDSGPGAVVFADSTSVTTGATIPMEGIYVLRLTANDGQLAASDTMTISASSGNQAPLVEAGVSQAITLPNSAILDGTVEDDGLPTSTITTTWSKLSGPGTVTFANANAEDTTASFSVAGNYVLRLVANDGLLTASDTVAISVSPIPNVAPAVNAGLDQAITLPDSATLDGTVTDDGLPSNTLVITWTKLSGPGNVTFADANAVDTTASFSLPGEYVLNLTAYDGALTESDSIAISVAPLPNTAPVVNAGPDQNITLPGSATLDGTVTDDGSPTSTITTTWSKLSGPGTVTFANANAVDTTASFSLPGEYVLRLTATDGALTASDSVAVSVAPAGTPNTAPVVNAGPDLQVPFPADATLDGTLTDDGVPAAATTTWSKVSGPGDVTFANANAVDTSASFSVEGDYVLRLTATDGEFTVSDDVSISTKAGNQAPVVNAGPDQQIVITGTATLDGTLIDDGLPAAATTTWSKVSGPGTVIFANANAVDTTATFSVEGSYVLRLTAADGEFTDSDDVTIDVEGTTGTTGQVDAGTGQNITLPDSATLDGTLQGMTSAATTTWSKVSGPGTVIFANANAVDTTATFSVAGSYVLRLTATDGELTLSDDVTINVSEADGGQTILLPNITK